jgi:hypothetical protein
MRYLFLFTIIATILISCGQNDIKQKELELKEREIVLKEKEFALKQNDSSTNKTIVTKVAISPTTEPKKDTAKKLPADTKFLTLMSPTYSFGDLAHLTFIDYATLKESEYEWYGDISTINEICKKCEDHEGCPSLKGQFYNATLKFILMDTYDFNKDGIISATGKKEKRWAIVALKKTNKP